MAFLTILDAITATATVSLRIGAIVFTQLHPLGKRYLYRIYAAFALSLLSPAAQAWRASRGTWHPSKVSRPKSAIAILFAGLIDDRRPRLSAASLFINCLSLLAVWDFLYRGQILHQSRELSFSRIGHVDETSVRVVVRAPGNSDLEDTTFVEMNLLGPSEENSGTQTTVSHTLPVTSEESDWMATFIFDGLAPDTTYTYSTNASHSGTFKTAHPSPKLWSLASTSCIKPFYPYNPLDHGLRIRGLEHLDRHISNDPVDLMLFLGDFIYIDLPIALGWSQQHYITAYRQTYASPSWTERLRSIPWLHVYDDHEIINDWAGNETGLYRPAMVPFQSYQGLANPPSQYGEGKTRFVFRRGDISFFVLDTRRYRSGHHVPDGPSKTMLGADQLRDLEEWLALEKNYKVVVSSVPFTRNWRGPDAADSWSGYMWERDYILDKMKKTEGVIILSGDRHEHATTLFPATDDSQKPVIDFSTSPLNQFYEPFTRFHKEVEDTDVSIFAHPYGNSKFGVATFDTTDSRHLLFTYKLVVDGQHIWRYNWTISR